MPLPMIYDGNAFNKWLSSCLKEYIKDDLFYLHIHYSDNKIESLLEHLPDLPQGVLIRVFSHYEKNRLMYQTEGLDLDLKIELIRNIDNNDWKNHKTAVYINLPWEPSLFFNDIFELINLGIRHFRIFYTPYDLRRLILKMDAHLKFIRKKFWKKPLINLSYSGKNIYHKMYDYNFKKELFEYFLSGTQYRLRSLASYLQIEIEGKNFDFCPDIKDLRWGDEKLLSMFLTNRNGWVPGRLWEVVNGMKISDVIYPGFGKMKGLEKRDFEKRVFNLINNGWLNYRDMGTRIKLNHGFKNRNRNECRKTVYNQIN